MFKSIQPPMDYCLLERCPHCPPVSVLLHITDHGTYVVPDPGSLPAEEQYREDFLQEGGALCIGHSLLKDLWLLIRSNCQCP